MTPSKFIVIPLLQAQKAADEAVNFGFAGKVTLFSGEGEFFGRDKISNFGDGIEILCEPRTVTKYLADRMEQALGVPVAVAHPRRDLPDMAGRATPILSSPRDWQWRAMARGRQFIPKIIGWKKRPIRYEARKGPQTLLVRNGDTSVGLLEFSEENGISYTPLPDSEWNEASLSDLTDKENLLAWLRGFLPSDRIIAGVARRSGMKLPKDPGSEKALFWFFKKFGRNLAGTITFSRMLAPFCLEARHEIRPVRDRISRSMPAFACSLSFPGLIFPGQEKGFPLDCDRGFWDAGPLSGSYYIPEKSYGAEAMESRIASLVKARSMCIPVTEHTPIDSGKLKGLALRRFDIHCGRVLWRAHRSQLGKMWISLLDRHLPKEDKEALVMRVALGFRMGFDGTDCTVYRLTPTIYPANGPDNCYRGLESPPHLLHKTRLAPFTGAKCDAAKKLDIASAATPEALRARASVYSLAGSLGIEKDFVDKLLSSLF